jgi:hypothetical protein
MTIQRWLVVRADATGSYIESIFTSDLCGYIKGIPRSLQDLAVEENWILPHIYEEIISPCDPTEEP